MDYQLAGNVAVDTGGGGSIGSAIATAVAKHGVTVAAWDVNQSAAELKAYEINSAGGCNKSTTTATELHFPDLQVDDMAHVFRQNYMATVISSQLVAKQFIKNNSGVILNISSIAGMLPLTRALSYSDAKAAVNRFTR